MSITAVPRVGTAFFPLDEELDLPASGLMPQVHQTLVRWAARLPFEEASEELHLALGVQISDSTARRLTLQAGASLEATQTEQASVPRPAHCAAVIQEEPPAQMAMSSDGGMVPLRGGVWAEVKTLVLAEVLPLEEQESTARTTAHSYFSRLADAQTFADLANVEIERRGIERAQAVCAVQDGAEWLQGFVDAHRPDAVRILDFAHAVEYLGQVAEQGKQTGHHLPAGWLAVMRHQFKHHGPDRVLAHLERLEQWWHLPAVADALRYLRKRRAHLQYPQFRAAGWPIGSGMVESANKIVMQARLKGAGMHWDAANVNPMLALRNALRNQRWEESWQHVTQRSRQQRHLSCQRRSEQRRAHLTREVTAQWLRLSLLLYRPAPPPPASPKGRTEAQKRWGRRPFTAKGARLQAAFAKI